ncbi:hypothetical protein ABPG73_012578 [Tetrahymena malaccensis]
MEEIAEKIFRLCLKNKVQFMTRDICQAAIKHIFQEEGECSIEYLDSGGFGLVLKYYNPNKLKKGAVKIIVGCAFSEEAMKETKKEIDLQININNPYIAKLKGFTKIVLDKTYLIGFIWMHYYEDGSLKSYLDRLREKNQEMDFKTKMRLGIELFDALSSMHQQNIFHRDIKAANILMNQDDCAIAYFDISIIQNVDQQLSDSIKGTPMFWDPEIHTGKSDKKMDLFAMGIVLLMMDNVVKFCYETHKIVNAIEIIQYYNTSFSKNQIIQELREKLNTNTIFFKIAEKLITTKSRSRLSAEQCLDILKEEEQRLNIFLTQVYSTKKYGLSVSLENEQEIESEFVVNKLTMNKDESVLQSEDESEQESQDESVYESLDESVQESKDESVVDEYGDESAYTNSVRNQSVKCFISSVSYKNKNSVFTQGQKNYQ